MPGIVMAIGVLVAMGGFSKGSTLAGVIGIVVVVVGAILFWTTSATRSYLNNNKKKW